MVISVYIYIYTEYTNIQQKNQLLWDHFWKHPNKLLQVGSVTSDGEFGVPKFFHGCKMEGVK